MIAYVFWHARRASVDGQDFERGLRAFHAGLAEHPPEGFASSVTLRAGPLPWMAGKIAYEDWYHVRDFTSIGILNERAASGGHADAHDHVASYSEHGTGSIYALEAGALRGAPGFMYWLDRPDGLSTPAFLDEMRTRVGDLGGELWRRQLSLGPATEYCIRGDAKMELPYRHLGVVPESCIWPGKSEGRW